jgi:hypothetical protein
MAGDDQSKGRCSKGLASKSHKKTLSPWCNWIQGIEKTPGIDNFQILMEMGGFWKRSKWSHHIQTCLGAVIAMVVLCECVLDEQLMMCLHMHTIKQQFYTWWCLDFKKISGTNHRWIWGGRFALRPKIYIGYDKKWANLWKGMIDPSLYCIGNQSIPYQVTIP